MCVLYNISQRLHACTHSRCTGKLILEKAPCAAAAAAAALTNGMRMRMRNRVAVFLCRAVRLYWIWHKSQEVPPGVPRWTGNSRKHCCADERVCVCVDVGDRLWAWECRLKNMLSCQDETKHNHIHVLYAHANGSAVYISLHTMHRSLSSRYGDWDRDSVPARGNRGEDDTEPHHYPYSNKPKTPHEQTYMTSYTHCHTHQRHHNKGTMCRCGGLCAARPTKIKSPTTHSNALAHRSQHRNGLFCMGPRKRMNKTVGALSQCKKYMLTKSNCGADDNKTSSAERSQENCVNILHIKTTMTHEHSQNSGPTHCENS